MNPYRQEMFAEMFGWAYEYSQLGQLALGVLVVAAVLVAVYELSQYCRRRGGKRAD
jgi:hypothetical protein